jgi:hypothetical protein
MPAPWAYFDTSVLLKRDIREAGTSLSNARNIPMNSGVPVRTSETTGDMDRGFDGHHRRQARLGLGLRPA